MKVVTLFGTRPEIIRLSCVIKHLDLFCDQVLIHTGQNYDRNLSDIFFEELGLRSPDIHLGIQATAFADQVGQIIAGAGEALARIKPDRLLLLGDTNSALTAIAAARMGIPVYHMEAGNRCYDDRVPEEINRRVVDHCSNVLMPYTHRSKDNLVREGIERQRIYVIGNPIYEVLNTHAEHIADSDVLTRLNVEPHKYFLVTLHRAENVDDPTRLEQLLRGLALVADSYQETMVVSLHPRTADKMSRFGLDAQSGRVRLLNPMGFVDFVKLERNAHCVLSDSGTVQEECSIFQVPNITVRDVTERAETIEVGSNMLTGAAPETVLQSVKVVLGSSQTWSPPPEYVEPHVSSTVSKIVLGYQHFPK
ncbi:MAG TPA: UDP-N-acetylglucosamine 2-epimerase (non-hydrolyzing) [Terriglobales bacterium]|nr:UDP-N-acetylglucosamine 2-epimerase (non-hydrolyzing) [Terriglobales bacterium]